MCNCFPLTQTLKISRTKRAFTILQTCQNRKTALDLVFQIDMDGGIKGYEQIDTRTELDEPKLCSLSYLFSFFGIAHYSSCQGSCNLSYHDFLSRFGLYADCCTLVECRTLWVFGYKVLSAVVIGIYDLSSDGITIYMHVIRRHKGRGCRHRQQKENHHRKIQRDSRLRSLHDRKRRQFRERARRGSRLWQLSHNRHRQRPRF